MIDTTLFGADLPAGTYSIGDMVQLGCVDGPSVVRSGRGAALLKRVTVGLINTASGSFSNWKIYVKNSDWIDPMCSMTTALRTITALDEKAGSVQRGNDCPLTPNSSWEVWAVAVQTQTTTIANSIFATIDVDYPAVSSIIDPDSLNGIPTTLEISKTVPANASGTLTTSSWAIANVDIFKAGYEYALQKVEAMGTKSGAFKDVAGFIAISNAAGMGGLKRIMPICDNPGCIRNKVEYASKLVKGPMDVSFMLFDATATADTADMNVALDFVKRRV